MKRELRVGGGVFVRAVERWFRPAKPSRRSRLAQNWSGVPSNMRPQPSANTRITDEGDGSFGEA
jgi:hypothetical protein